MNRVSLITINLHCLEEQNIEDNQNIIVQEIINKNADIVFLQEVAQYDDKDNIDEFIKESNYGYELHQLLTIKGYEYYYVYRSIKSSFGKYDEGLGILSKSPLFNIESKYISSSQDYSNWRSRKYLKATSIINDIEIDFITSHLGWDSRGKSYMTQMNNLYSSITNKHTIIGGDFNIASGSDYYNQTVQLGLIDLYGIDISRMYDFTFENDLDVHVGSARIDYIFSTMKYQVIEQEVIFKDPMVSDHYGIYMKIQL